MYIYIESSEPARKGDFASLVSEELPAKQDVCLSFYYNMYGQGMGELTVTLEVRTLYLSDRY